MTRRPFFLILAIALMPGILPAVTHDIVEGNPDSPVKVTIYGDLQSGECQSLRAMLDEKLLPKYGKKVAFIHRDFPLGRHNWAREAAMAARWVHEQSPSLGIVFRRELLAEQDHITPANLKPWVREFATRNHLNPDAIEASLTDQRLSTIVDQDIQMASARGLTKVPSVFVAGQMFAETIIYDDLARAIDSALAR